MCDSVLVDELSPNEDFESSCNRRRPMNAFLLFCKRHRGIVKNKYPNLENRNITKILGGWWASLSSEEKSSFTDLALEYKAHFLKENPSFKWRKTTSSPEYHHHETSSSSKEDDQPSPLRSNEEQPQAPKPFKKRLLAAHHETNNHSSSEEACKALLQLAGAPPNNKEEPPKGGFKTLRDAVWTRVARNFLKQEEERTRLLTTSNTSDDAPINASTQCTIQSQTIIEHIIENILDKTNDDVSSTLNNNGNILETAEQIKERIYQSLKTDLVKDKNEIQALRKSLPNPTKAVKPKTLPQNNFNGNSTPAVTITSVNTETPLNLSTTPPSTPAVSCTPILDPAADDDPHRRSSRSCKGRRYQELKDEGRLGRKCRSRTRSGDLVHEDDIIKKVKTADNNVPPVAVNGKPFNVTAKLNALPALSLEEYQLKASKAKSSPISANSPSNNQTRNTRSANGRKKSGEEENRRKL